MTLPVHLNTFLFGYYPYICLAILFLGSLVRYDREPYSWKSDSSQILKTRELRWGSNLFHWGVIIVVLGHFGGFLMPESLVLWLMSPTQHQLLAMIVGGIAGSIALIGISILIHRRLRWRRVRSNSRKWDVAIAVMLWLQLLLGVATVPLSAQHMDGAMFERLVAYVQGVVLFRPDHAALLQGTAWVYQLHILLGFTIFLVSPFTRMVHIWSGVGSLIYLIRPRQIVRKRGRPVNP
jgi:nitrate reductase gamma subunit